MPRPEIPADIRRRVLVEAGHRCAIPSCKNPDVDVHHIIPWEKCQAHEADNLIALCPNCHRRAHKGEIDRKSLLIYKTQLRSLIRPLSAHESVESRNGSQENYLWETRAIDIEDQGEIPYSVSIEYPYFLGDDQDFSILNAVLTGEAYGILLSERMKAFGLGDAGLDEWWREQGNSYTSSYTVASFSEKFISVKISAQTYSAGAAHGMYGSYGENYFLNPLRKIILEEQFKESEESLGAISRFCIAHLETENHRDEPDGWVREGAGCLWSNFESFLVTNSSIILLSEARLKPPPLGGQIYL